MSRNAMAPSCQVTVLSALRSAVTTTLAHGSSLCLGAPSPRTVHCPGAMPTRLDPSLLARTWCQNRPLSEFVAEVGLS